MELDHQSIQKLFTLAKLNIKKDQEDKLTNELSSLLSWVGTLQTANTQNVGPLTHPVPLILNCNDDLPPENISLNNALKNAPESDNNHFLVPRVIDQV